MRRTKRFVIAAPFLIAAVLSVLMLAADRLDLYRERIAGYGFLFATPWAWLIDLLGWFPRPHNWWLQLFLGSVLFLWIPAFLYSTCVWLLFLGLAKTQGLPAR